MTGRIKSDRAIELVNRHRESIEGFVRRHSLDRYQINKLIKAETALRDRNSVLNFLRKEKNKIEMEEEREKALEQDIPNNIDETGSDRIGDLKDDIVEIREQMTDILGSEKPSFDSTDSKSSINHVKDRDSEEEPVENVKQDLESDRDEESSHKDDETTGEDNEFSGTVIPDDLDRTDTGGSISADEKSRGELQREVNTYFAGLPGDEELDGIASNFKDLLPEEKKQELDGKAVNPVEMFEELRGKSLREKAIKSSYAVKKAFERNRGTHMSYYDISEEVKNMEVVRKPIDTSEFFRYMQDYDGVSRIDFDKVDSAVHDCKRVIRDLENS